MSDEDFATPEPAAEPAPEFTADDQAELASLQADMADSRGARAANWRESYHHSPHKQQRYRELLEKQMRANGEIDEEDSGADEWRPMSDDEVEGLASELGVGTGDVQAGYKREQQLADMLGEDFAEIQNGFASLPDESRLFVRAILADPHSLHARNARLSPEARAAINKWIHGLSDRAHDAIYRVTGIGEY